MLNTISQTRNIVIKHAMQKVLAQELEVDQGLRLIAALDEEYVLMCDSLKRWERACFMITDNRTVILGGGEK
jgi:hypothetical protein